MSRLTIEMGWLLALGWVGQLVLFFTWAPWLLVQKQVGRRDMRSSAALTALGLVILMLVSDQVMQFWGRPVCPRLRRSRSHPRDLRLDRLQLIRDRGVREQAAR